MSDFLQEGEVPYLKFPNTRTVTKELQRRFDIYKCPIFSHNGTVYAGPFKRVCDAYKLKIRYSKCSNRETEVVGMRRIGAAE